MRLVRALTVLALAALSGPALADKGLGAAYNTKYKAYGIRSVDYSDDRSVELSAQRIETVNCGGCYTVLYGPGTIFHLRNVGKTPVCASWEFTPVDRRDWIVHRWGSGQAYYIKPGQRLAKVSGLYAINGGDTGQVDLGYEGSIRTWQPVSKKRC